jgi:hypothetical protein
VIGLWGSNLRRVGGNLWYIEKSEVSTLLFVGCFPRGDHGWSGLSRVLVFRVVYAHIWLVFRVGWWVRKFRKTLEVWVGVC